MSPHSKLHLTVEVDEMYTSRGIPNFEEKHQNRPYSPREKKRKFVLTKEIPANQRVAPEHFCSPF